MSQTTVRARYQVIARIASGGMGEVFRARDSVLDREVAIKVLHRNLAGDPGFIDRFRLEARAAALLSHPNIVAVHDWGSTTNGTYFMVMEFVAGLSLRDLLVAHGRLEPQQAVEVLLQMLSALDHAHRKGIVHRDVKPENVLVTPDGVVKVADFGLARAYAEARVSQAPGTVTGTVQYLAPEQIQGEPADPRTDLYALGIVAYELLTGDVPFTGETSVAIAYKHLSDTVPAPSKRTREVPLALDRIVLAATSKDREQRPGSAAVLRKELVRAAGGLPPADPLSEVIARLPAPAPEVAKGRAATVTIPRTVSPKARRRRRRNRILAAILALALAAGGGWAAWAFAIPHYTRVPDVVGIGDALARERLEAAGLDLQFGREVPSTTVPKGQVVSEAPAAGTKVRKGTDVVVHLSAGLPLRPVPDVVGDTEELARQELQAQHFQVLVTRAFDPDVPEGRVIEQNPDSSQSILFGGSVTITISKGPQPVHVPNVVGHDVADAEQVLISAQFTVTRRSEYSTDVPVDRVIRQRPEEGLADFGSRVIIWVSLGPKPFEMPNVVGEATDQARSELENLGLHVVVVSIPGSAGGEVVGQRPDPGSTVNTGQTVTIYVSL